MPPSERFTSHLAREVVHEIRPSSLPGWWPCPGVMGWGCSVWAGGRRGYEHFCPSHLCANLWTTPAAKALPPPTNGDDESGGGSATNRSAAELGQHVLGVSIRCGKCRTCEGAANVRS